MSEISVIVPVYNVEQYLPRCIDSILQQTFTDFEIILVDDGSEDGSGHICDSYAVCYSNIQVIHQENTGVALARKIGVYAAEGSYIMFVDPDDWIDCQMLETMYMEAIDANADVVCAQFRRIDEKGHLKKGSDKQSMSIICEDRKEMIYHMHVTRTLSTSAWGKLIKKDIVSSINFPKGVVIGEDHDMIVQMIEKTSKLILTNNIFYNYFIRRNGASRLGYSKMHENSLNNYLKIESKLENMYPEYRSEIRGFYAEYEMAVVTAMCRNQKYDWKVIDQLRFNLRQHMNEIIRNSQTAFYLKMSALLITYIPNVFIIIFSALHLVTGR